MSLTWQGRVYDQVCTQKFANQSRLVRQTPHNTILHLFQHTNLRRQGETDEDAR